MVHHETKLINGKPYHYLVKTLRAGGKVKKLRLYAGKGAKTAAEMESLARKKAPVLEKRAAAFQHSRDTLLSLLTAEECAAAEKVKAAYRKRVASMDGMAKKNAYEWFLAQFTYDTNAIEGSTLSLQDTSLILFENTVPKGKTPREINEVQNHKQAYDYILAYTGNLTKRFLLELHRRLMHNILWEAAGRLRDVDVYIRGVDLKPPSHQKVSRELNSLLKWLQKGRYHPIVRAAYFHAAFEAIHPFRDGNGRAGRLLLNFMLKKDGYPMVDIKNKDKEQYYTSLYAAQKNQNLRPLALLILRYLTEAAAGR